MSTTDDYDFGFSFADSEEVAVTTQAQQTVNNSNEDIAELKEKLDSILSAQEQTLNAALAAAIEEKYKAKLKEVEGLIMPLLSNLKKNPTKAYINWPNREGVINKQIEKILAVTRG